jgi:hypothetical protein
VRALGAKLDTAALNPATLARASTQLALVTLSG